MKAFSFCIGLLGFLGRSRSRCDVGVATPFTLGTLTRAPISGVRPRSNAPQSSCGEYNRAVACFYAETTCAFLVSNACRLAESAKRTKSQQASLGATAIYGVVNR